MKNDSDRMWTTSILTVLTACLATLIGGCASTSSDASRPVARINQGELRGGAEGGVERFLNIPYAAAPVGDLRWRPPMPAPSWRDSRDAGSFGPACPQPIRPAIVAGGVADRQSEDCLQLNIWRPQGGEGLPVIVWIHGGAHVIGSGVFPAFDGARLAQQGAVVVTVNYRLGLLGYFAHPALTNEAPTDAPLGNYGLMDQIAALKWVKDNIAAFGGDPAKVTVMGESAGAISIEAMLANPAARGLFDKAIIQSTVGLADFDALEQQERTGRAAASRARLSDEASAAELRALSVEKILDMQGVRSGGRIGPFIDGRLIHESPWRAFARGAEIDIPLLIGANSDEASVILAMGAPAAAARDYVGADETAARAAYGADLSAAEFSRQVLGDAWFVAPARWLAEQTSRGSPTYLYHFDYVAAARRNTRKGAAHGSEVPYIFQTLDYLESVAGAMTDEDREFARRISECWVSFAANGQPDCSLVRGWPAYESSSDALALIGPQPRVVEGFRKAQIDFLLKQKFTGSIEER